MKISDFLHSLKPSGECSFENLVGKLLGALTGLRFFVARSGDQGAAMAGPQAWPAGR
jgi:hypothetical protein